MHKTEISTRLSQPQQKPTSSHSLVLYLKFRSQVQYSKKIPLQKFLLLRFQKVPGCVKFVSYYFKKLNEINIRKESESTSTSDCSILQTIVVNFYSKFILSQELLFSTFENMLVSLTLCFVEFLKDLISYIVINKPSIILCLL